MKKINYFLCASVCVAMVLCTISCKAPTDDKTAAAATETAPEAAAMPDMVKIKADIQALETAWSAADNARDTNGLSAFYSDDAVTLSNNKPMISGKAAIHKDIVASMAKRAKGGITTYDVMNVYGDGKTVTEIGTTTRKDAAGKVTYTGKYMAVWEMRDGKYICVADISNDDVKEK